MNDPFKSIQIETNINWKLLIQKNQQPLIDEQIFLIYLYKNIKLFAKTGLRINFNIQINIFLIIRIIYTKSKCDLGHILSIGLIYICKHTTTSLIIKDSMGF